MDFALDAIQLDFEPGRLLVLNVILALLMFGVALDLKIEDFRAHVADRARASVERMIAIGTPSPTSE